MDARPDEDYGPFDPYTAGLLEGVTMYATMNDGQYHVGALRTPLQTARRQILDERGFTEVPDPRYVGLRQ